MSDSLGGVTQYAYDPEDRLTKLTAPWGTEYDFGYDVDGQLISIDDLLDPSKSKGTAYDDLNRLVQVAEGTPVANGGTQLPIEDYAYDEEGNRTASHLSVLYAPNDHNQLLEDEEFTYAYDEKGNRVSKTAKVGGDVETYSYDSQNRLVGYASPTTTANYAYDALERRIAKTVDGSGTAYVYDTSAYDPLAMDDIALEFETGPLPTLKRRWTHSNAIDEPVGFESYDLSGPAGSGTERLIYADRQGSILWVTDPASRDLVAAYEYDGFGQISQTQGTLVQPYGYTGREYDKETGLYYYRARFFDPIQGTFISSDPAGFLAGQLNLFTYVGSDPVNYDDPTGLFRRTSNTPEYGVISTGGEAIRSSSMPVATGAALGLATRISLALAAITISGPPNPDPKKNCVAEKAAKNAADAALRGFRNNSCLSSGGLSRMQLESRLYLWLALLEARKAAAQCHNDGDSTHMDEIEKARKQVEDCARRLGL